jgi:hypothetical protein
LDEKELLPKNSSYPKDIVALRKILNEKAE